MVHHDLVVLGAGPGGYVAAVRAAQLGLNVAIIEKQYWGGVCLNVGCVPAKALIRNAEIARVVTAEAGLYGITGVTSVDYGIAFDRSRKVSDARAKGVNFLMRKNNITQYDGTGTFEGPRRMRADLLDGSKATIDFDHAIIATGSTTRLLPGVELSPNVVTYKELILSRELPSSIVIVGAGAIGLEFAYILRNYGVDVTVIEYADRPLPNEDVDISKEVSRAAPEARRPSPHLD